MHLVQRHQTVCFDDLQQALKYLPPKDILSKNVFVHVLWIGKTISSSASKQKGNGLVLRTSKDLLCVEEALKYLSPYGLVVKHFCVLIQLSKGNIILIDITDKL